MAKYEAPQGAKILTIRVTLKEITPLIWRRFQVPDSITLEDLHYVLQLVMGWSNCHLHEFQIGKKLYGAPDPDYDDEMVSDERAHILRDLLKRKGVGFNYHYDFGDYWEHRLVVEEISEPQPGTLYPVCLAGARCCPPEDCGGPYGFREMLKKFRNPKHKDYEALLDWLPEDYDPEKFELASIDMELGDTDLLRYISEDGDDSAVPGPRPVYEEPVRGLLSLGDIDIEAPPLDYAKRGIGPEHVPSLIQMAGDMSLHWAEQDSTEVWAPVHAWRALGQLRAESAVRPLLELFRMIDDGDDDWVAEDLPHALTEIGMAAVPALCEYLQDGRRGNFSRIAAAESISGVGLRYPETRETCVAALTAQLERHNDNDGELNGFLICFLMDHKAMESIPAIESAFADDAVNESIVGDWEDVQIAFGLLDKRTKPRDLFEWVRSAPPRPAPQVLGKNVQKVKKRRKDQKQARKKNRKK